METLRNFGTTAPGVVVLAAFAALAALACSSQEDGTAEASSGSSSAGGPGTSGSGATGGSSATAGSSTTVGSSATAGSSGGGGVGGSGGSTASGEAGAGAAGSGSSGSGGETQSAGCGSATAPRSGRFSIDVGGATREYILAVPDDYDASHAYRLIFAWHPRGGSADQVATGFGGGYYGLQGRADGSAIFVSPEGIDQGWENRGGRDIAFLRAMLDRLNAELCIDQSRVFSTGFSYGGMMSYAIGCAMGDVFRAIGSMSGALYSGCEDGDSPVAMWGAHGDADDIVPVENGRSARDVFLERNHCDQQTKPVSPTPCVSYEGCDAGYPVVWCEFSGGHAPQNNSGESIWNFFSQF
ncbi:alpha/beta hydrolase family esterase [Sorangium cellulosum]|uniref:Ricin and poly(3-hydroxybutyrate) depolymerase fusion n=1 Tax=Sorangium cellulosum TaxID=56 RepID=A0A150QV92_SORCE|nr:prolyl oligopeptidase family serine peptidase [Sorangium cellulosum]KYF71880.1 Ricin and poly(3-hydroxybutyrate) depolymerase fusion [Sorangium cellulosum]